jgi:ankyrin repeat protein
MSPINLIQRFFLTLAGMLLIAPLLWAGPLHDAAETDDTTRIKQLIKEGKDINEVDNQGIWPLLAAASNGNVTSVEFGAS